MPPDLRLRITGRRSSHFTRVALIVAHELGLPVDLTVVHDLGSLDVERYGGNPALRVPTLQLDHASGSSGGALWGTDNICRKLVALAGPDAARVVTCDAVQSDLGRCAQELVWHAMAAQVQLRVGLAVAGLPADNLFFVKARAGMSGALGWLDAHLDAVLATLPASRAVSVLEVALFCLVEHVAFRPTLSLSPFPRLRAFAMTFGERDSARATPYGEVTP